MNSYLLIALTFSRPIRDMLAAQCLAALGTGMFSVLFNLYLKSSGYSEDLIGKLLAMQALSAALASVPLARLADRVSRRSCYILSIVLLAAGYVLASSTTGFWPLAFAASLAGIGSGGQLVSVQPYLHEHSRRRQRTYLFSLNFTLTLTMYIVAGLLAGWLPKLAEGFGLLEAVSETERLRHCLQVGAGFSLLAVLLARRISEPSRPQAATRVTKTAGQDMAPGPSPRLLIGRYVLTTALTGAGAGLIVPYFNLYFRDWVGSSVAEIGTVFALSQLTTAIGGALSPLMTRRVGLAAGVTLTQLASLPFMLVMAHTHDFWLCAGSFLFRGAFMNMGIPIREQLMMATVPPALRASAAAAESIAWFLSWGLVMSFSGTLIMSWGYPSSLYITFGLYLTASVLFWLWFRPHASPRAATFSC
ncbi:MAG TPA: MFS transporter [Candidatus Ozemobacteraceae bacterium]|nr:MFS transporter [Candidatus Ozemobacteraceae bacterium]